MTLTVEDGSGLAAADAYDSVANVEAYLTLYGGPSTAWNALSASDKEVHVRKATRYLDAVYADRWKGVRANEGQALDWPRSGSYDSDGYLIDSTGSDSVPVALRQAMAELAQLSVGENLIPDQASPGAIKSKAVRVGPISRSTQYVSGLSQAKFYRLADSLLAPLLEPANRLYRA